MYKIIRNRDPIFKEVNSNITKSREVRELPEIKPIGIGKDELREQGIEVITTDSDYMCRPLSVKISVVADDGTAWLWADTPPKMKKIIKKLLGRCTTDQQWAFKSLYGEVDKIPKGKLNAACAACSGYLRKDKNERNTNNNIKRWL